MALKQNIFLKILLLELLCYVPLAIIAGNVLPPIGFLKIHWIYIGLTFIVALLTLIQYNHSGGLLLVIFFFIVAQLTTGITFSASGFVDFIAGPLVFIAVVSIVVDDVGVSILKKKRKKMLIFFALPIVLALLQYVKILPLEFMNARYVNVTQYGTEILQRVNGFLYHGIELVVIIFFFFACIIIPESGLKVYFILALMILAEFVTIIKAGILAAMMFSGYYAYFIDRRLRSLKSIAIGIAVVLGFSVIYTLIPDLQNRRFDFNLDHFRFDNQLFTGRGYIWNVYIEGLKDFSWLQILFGGGFGSAPTIFEAHAIGPINWSPGTHNTLLELLINGGLFAVLLLTLIHIKQYEKITSYFRAKSSAVRLYYISVLVIPLLTIGLTAPITSMFIYWCGLSAVVLTFKVKFQ